MRSRSLGPPFLLSMPTCALGADMEKYKKTPSCFSVASFASISGVSHFQLAPSAGRSPIGLPKPIPQSRMPKYLNSRVLVAGCIVIKLQLHADTLFEIGPLSRLQIDRESTLSTASP